MSKKSQEPQKQGLVRESESQDVQAELGKMKEKDLLRLAWLCTFDHWNLDEKFSAVGVSAQKVRKEARARALTEWEKHQKEQAEAANTKKEATAVNK